MNSEPGWDKTNGLCAHSVTHKEGFVVASELIFGRV